MRYLRGAAQALGGGAGLPAALELQAFTKNIRLFGNRIFNRQKRESKALFFQSVHNMLSSIISSYKLNCILISIVFNASKRFVCNVVRFIWLFNDQNVLLRLHLNFRAKDYEYHHQKG